MDKKDIYEHLAKIYLDASSKRKKKKKTYPKFFKNIYFVSAIGLLFLGVIFALVLPKNKYMPSETALVLVADAAKINFNFEPAKKESFSLNLKNLDLKKFNCLGFCVKKKNNIGVISLKIEFGTSFKEKSFLYVKNIPYKWQDYKLSFSEFKHIANWSNITNLSFTVEEWNSTGKEGVVYIDNVRLLR